MKQYLNSLNEILTHGSDRDDRTGVGTRSLFGQQLRFDLQAGFPAVTTKKLAWRAVVSELLWFIEGSGDERRLREILHGDRYSEKGTIWTANATAPYWEPKSKFNGDLGRVYGVQWRHWRTPVSHTSDRFKDEFGNYFNRGGPLHVKEVDQLNTLIAGIKADPNGRRHILTAWNPGELDAMALPPCHCFAQFYVNDNKLSCQMYQRSADFFLGVPFNIASYALFTHLIAQVCGLGVGELILTFGDGHIYQNHFDQVREQLARDPLPLPVLKLNSEIKSIDGFTMSDIQLLGYESHSSIKAEMAV
jgi:thymidylate synthase